MADAARADAEFAHAAQIDEERALSLLGNYLLDVPAGRALFDEPLRLARDLLDDAAAAHIKKMKFDP